MRVVASAAIGLTALVATGCGRGADTVPPPRAPTSASARQAPAVEAAPVAVPAAQVPAASDVTFSALDAVVREGAVVFVVADGTEARSVDVATGVERWRAPLGAASQLAIIHDLGGGRLFVQVPGRATTLDAATGRVVAARAASRDWEFVHHGMGGCALRSDCALAPIACEDGRPLGPPLVGQSEWIQESDEHGNMRGDSQRCDADASVLAIAGELTLFVARNLEHGPTGTVVRAIDAGGRTRWSAAAPACAQCAPLGGGASPDGRLCWTTDRAHEGEALVRGFDCATGQVRFSRALSIDRATAYAGLVTGFVPTPPSILVVARGSVTTLAPNGATRWTRAIPVDAIALPIGLRVASFPLALEGFRAIVHVDATTGATVRAEQLAEGRELRVGDDSAIAVVRAGATGDRGGARVPAPEVFSFVRDRAGSHALWALA